MTRRILSYYTTAPRNTLMSFFTVPTMKSTSTLPKITTMTSKDSIKGAIHAFALGMIVTISMLVVDCLIAIALLYIRTYMTMSFRMLAILDISMSIMQISFHLAIIGWFLKRHDYEPVIIIPLILGSLFGILLWVTLDVHNLNPFLNSFGLELKSLEGNILSTLWFIVIVLYVIVLQQEKRKQPMVQENSDDQEYFAYTLMIV